MIIPQMKAMPPDDFLCESIQHLTLSIYSTWLASLKDGMISFLLFFQRSSDLMLEILLFVRST